MMKKKTLPPELTDVCLAPVQPSISALLRVSRHLQPPLLAQTGPDKPHSLIYVYLGAFSGAPPDTLSPPVKD